MKFTPVMIFLDASLQISTAVVKSNSPVRITANVSPHDAAGVQYTWNLGHDLMVSSSIAELQHSYSHAERSEYIVCFSRTTEAETMHFVLPFLCCLKIVMIVSILCSYGLWVEAANEVSQVQSAVLNVTVLDPVDQVTFHSFNLSFFTD